jgi:adenosylcobinamide-GDP ribazoletransferase
MQAASTRRSRLADAAGAEVRAAAAAVAFLTRVPMGRWGAGGELSRGAPAFPFVGALVGAAAGGAAILLAGPAPPLVAAGVGLAIAALVTGALHLDALADTADALGARSRERALAIMRDPRTGSFGVSAIALVLLVEAGALATLAERREFGATVAAFALSRAVAPVLGGALPYARSQPGLGRALTGCPPARAAASALLACGLVVALARGHAPELIVTAAICAAAALATCARRFGGVTGDTLGAAIAVTEAACLAVAASA